MDTDQPVYGFERCMECASIQTYWIRSLGEFRCLAHMDAAPALFDVLAFTNG